MSCCNANFSSDDHDLQVVDTPIPMTIYGSFLYFPEQVAGGVIVFYMATLGNERSAPVRLYKNGKKNIPECLRFLLEEQRLGDLLGIGAQ